MKRIKKWEIKKNFFKLFILYGDTTDEQFCDSFREGTQPYINMYPFSLKPPPI